MALVKEVPEVSKEKLVELYLIKYLDYQPICLCLPQSMRCNAGYKLGIQTIALTDISKELHIILNPKKYIATL